jgi:hypothetical protein
MQPRTFILTVTLGTAMAFGTTTLADELPKEGTYNTDYYAYGTFKAVTIGKDRVLATFDENGLWPNKGFGDHVTWHCFGLADITSGMEQVRGYCVGTDPDGDQLVGDVASDGKFPANAKSFVVKVTYTTGTGKYTGITGGHISTCHGHDFRTAAEGSYALYNTNSGSYKLP